MLLILILIIILYLLSTKSIENIINSPQIKFNKYKELDLIDKRPIMMGQNWDKSYKELPTGKDSEKYQRLPNSNPQLNVFNDLDNKFIPKKKFEKFIKTLINDDIKKYGKFVAISLNNKSKNNLSRKTLWDINKETWKSSWYLYNPVNKKYKGPIKSKLKMVNKIINYFKNMCKEFKINRYYVKNIKQNIKNKNIFIYNLIMTLTKKNQQISYTIYVSFVINNSKITIVNIEHIGVYFMDRINLLPGYNNNEKDYFNILESDPKFYKNLKQSYNYLYKRKKNLYENQLSEQYMCINENPEYYKIGDPIFNMSKQECSEKIDKYGRSKPYGKWELQK